jgi:hypothetical protein
VNELRRELLDEGDASEELGPELRDLAVRTASAAALLVHHGELYKEVYARYRAQGPSDELDAIVLDAAGNLATVLQTLRRREDLLTALAHSPTMAAPPLILVDQLLYSFMLMMGPEDDEALVTALTPEDIDAIFTSDRVREWLASFGATGPPTMPTQAPRTRGPQTEGTPEA